MKKRKRREKPEREKLLEHPGRKANFELFKIKSYSLEEMKNLPYETLMSNILAPSLDNLTILCRKKEITERTKKEIIKTCHSILNTHMHIMLSLDLLD